MIHDDTTTNGQALGSTTECGNRSYSTKASPQNRGNEISL